MSTAKNSSILGGVFYCSVKDGGIYLNIFLTGEKQVGKSTIIDLVLNELLIRESTVGFKTSLNTTIKLRTFSIESINIPISKSKCLNIGYYEKGEKFAITSTFEDVGVEILERCLLASSQFVVLDELGFFEEDAISFQGKLHQVLDSNKVVLGVIKRHSSSFLDSIRQRDDILLFDVTIENREDIYEKVLTLIAKTIKGSGVKCLNEIKLL